MRRKHENKLVFGDCQEHLPKTSSGTVDLCFWDPPFNLSKEKHYKNGKSDRLPENQYFIEIASVLMQLRRVLKKNGIMLVYFPSLTSHKLIAEAEKAGFILKQSMVISTPVPFPPRQRLVANYHFLHVFQRSDSAKMSINHRRRPVRRCRSCGETVSIYKSTVPLHSNGVWINDLWLDMPQNKRNRRRKGNSLHIKLLLRCIEMFSDPGALVLDPMAGTGTTAAAAKWLGRQYIAIELAEKSNKIMIERLKNDDVDLRHYAEYIKNK